MLKDMLFFNTSTSNSDTLTSDNDRFTVLYFLNPLKIVVPILTLMLVELT